MNEPSRAGFPASAAKALGWLSAWAFLTCALTLASRSIHLGPGFANPLPYAVVALAMNLAGRSLRRWLGERRAAPQPQTGWKLVFSGPRAFFHDTAGFNNFLLLSLAYFLGMGPSALIGRLAGGKKSPGGPQTTFWIDADLRKKEADAYRRPY